MCEEDKLQGLMQLIERSFADEDIRPERIPEIDLYMDQIISFFEDHLSGNKRHESDKLLTKTMINNYSKEGLIKPVKGKKYSREHMMQMLMIYSMKNTLTVKEMKNVMHGVYEQPDFGAQALETCYSRFLHIKQLERETVPQMINDIFLKGDSQAQIRTKGDLLVLLLSLSAASAYMKRIAECIVDEFFEPQRE